MFSYVPYGVTGIQPQQIFGDISQTDTGPAPASAANNSAPGTQSVGMSSIGDHAITISWLGLLLAFVLLRIVYELSE
jgi:hypothetical protein